MLIMICFILLLVSVGDVTADSLGEAIGWNILPGGGHFYLGEFEEGIAYLSSISVFGAAGVWMEERNEKLDRYDEVNSFYIIAQKIWELSFFTTYRSFMRRHYRLEDIGIDRSSVVNLFFAPFRMDNISDFYVLAAGGMGIVLGSVSYYGSKRKFKDIERIEILGLDPLDRNDGSAVYALDSFGLSLAASVSEEALWRGIIQNELEISLGKSSGLVVTAGLFGMAHIIDLDGSINFLRVLPATLGGLYLGYVFQQNNHKLARPIAAHFWYNFMLMLTAFVFDPENNPLGVKIEFKL